MFGALIIKLVLHRILYGVVIDIYLRCIISSFPFSFVWKFLLEEHGTCTTYLSDCSVVMVCMPSLTNVMDCFIER